MADKESKKSAPKLEEVTLTKVTALNPGDAIEFTNDSDKFRFADHVKDGVCVLRCQLKIGMVIRR